MITFERYVGGKVTKEQCQWRKSDEEIENSYGESTGSLNGDDDKMISKSMKTTFEGILSKTKCLK